ncbi:MAG: YwiC-like family protein [Chloroflexi bacterium]|nr:YwiC-like family protein [Chloroflexota bacterium]
MALPAEHGGWAMLISPILLGFLVVPSITAVFLALAIIASFLARTPLKIVWKDSQKGRRFARTTAAMKVLVLYVFLIVVGFGGALYFGGWQPLMPLLAVLPLLLLLLYFDLFSTSRQLLSQLVAPIVLSSVTAGMALAAGWTWPYALALWSIPLMLSIPAILYVRSRIRMDKDRAAGARTAVLSHVLAAIVAIALAATGYIPALAALAIFILMLRAATNLSTYRRPMTIKQLGWSEIAFSLMTVFMSAIGYWLI